MKLFQLWMNTLYYNNHVEYAKQGNPSTIIYVTPASTSKFYYNQF